MLGFLSTTFLVKSTTEHHGESGIPENFSLQFAVSESDVDRIANQDEMYSAILGQPTAL